MIYILTIAIAVFIAWNILTICLVLSSDDISLDISYDGILITIAKIYWYAIAIIIVGCILLGISYFISRKIICSVNHGDSEYCFNLESKGDE